MTNGSEKPPMVRGVGAGLHPVWRGVYALGRPALTHRGRWMAAVLACGPGAVGSHMCAGAIWQIVAPVRGPIDVSVPEERHVARPGIRIHRSTELGPQEVTERHGIPVTTPIRTLIDLATCLDPAKLEAAVNQADRRDLVDPETLRLALERYPGRGGLPALRGLLDRRTFGLTESELERRFLPIARAAGLPPPLAQEWVNGFRVDFFWPELGLVVETDGLRYHRTPAQRARPRPRSGTHRGRPRRAAVHPSAGRLRRGPRARDARRHATRLRR